MMMSLDVNVRYWPKANIRSDALDVRFWPKADVRCYAVHVRF